MNKNFPETCQDYEKGCGLKESVGSPVCKKDNLCNDCSLEYLGYLKGSLERFEEWIEYLFYVKKFFTEVGREDIFLTNMVFPIEKELSQNIELAKEKIKEYGE